MTTSQFALRFHKALQPLLWATCLIAALAGCKSKGEAPVDQAPAEVHAEPAEHTEHAEHTADDGDEPNCHAHGEEMPAAELPGTSIFHLTQTFTNTKGEEIQLSSLRGKPSVFVMFYGSCTTACPLLFSDARQIEADLAEDVRKEVQFVFVTIDPERDTRESLAAYAQNLNLDMDRWSLLRATDAATRALSTVLGVQYRADGQGEFNHTNRISVVDGEGTVVHTLDGLRQPNESAVRALTNLVH